MDKVSVFESSDFGELRIIVDPKGDVWFVASDVAKSLGYINAKDAVKRHVDDDDSMLLQVSDNQWGVKRSILKTRYIDSIRIINESGLYSLILSSKLESAKRFKKWVTSEVLPSIRKTGEYKTSWKKGKEGLKSANVVMKWRTGNTGGWVTNPTRPITMETTDTTVTDLRCVEVADVAEVVLIEEQTQRIQLIRNM